MLSLVRLAALLGLLAAWPAAAQPSAVPAHTLRTLAGTPPNGSPGSTDGPALQARFNWPRGLAQAADGTLYVADTFSGTIRKISPAGEVSTLAGKAPAADYIRQSFAASGYADGAGEQARFNRPVGVAVDAAGTVYVADQGNHCVRKITPDGTVSTLAGTPRRSYGRSQGEVPPLGKPLNITLGPDGNLYVPDDESGCVYRVQAATGTITTWLAAGMYEVETSMRRLPRRYSPVSVAFDKQGTGYVGDSHGFIRKVTREGKASLWVGELGGGGFADGTGAAAQLGTPTGLAFAPDGTLYVADERYALVRRISPAGQVATVAGRGDVPGARNGPSQVARFGAPCGLVVRPDGTLLVADELNSFIRQVSPQGQVSTLAGAPVRLGGDDGPGVTAQFRFPDALAVDAAGNVYVAETGNEAIRKVAPDGQVSTFFGGRHRPDYQPVPSVYLHQPTGVAVGPAGTVYVAEAGVNTLYQLTPQGAISPLAGRHDSQGGAADGAGDAARFNHPTHLACGPAGSLYVLDYYNALVRRVSPQGVVSTPVGKLPAYMEPLDPRWGNPTGLAVAPNGTLYVSDGTAHVIRRLVPGGAVSVWAGEPGQVGSADGSARLARFNQPAGLAFDRQGNLYVADAGNSTVRCITPAGQVTTLAGEPGQPGYADGPARAGRFSRPVAVAVGADGAVYVTDLGNDLIRVVR